MDLKLSVLQATTRSFQSEPCSKQQAGANPESQEVSKREITKGRSITKMYNYSSILTRMQLIFVFQLLQPAPYKRVRKADYRRAERATYCSKGRKQSIQKATQARWRKQFGTESSLQMPLLDEGTSSASAPGTSGIQAAKSVSNTMVPHCMLEGSRIVNVSELAKGIHTLTSHSASCGGACVLEGETMHSELAVIFSATCTKCTACFSISSSHQVKTSKGKRWAVNLGAVLGHMSTGGGQQRLNTTLAYMNVPGMPKMFSATDSLLGEEMKQQLFAAITEAGKEEREHAISLESFYQGIPAITVVADGGWSKRSHKHSYNAKSGVAVILGHYTKKLFFLGVRNKLCSVCTVARRKEQEPPPHQCYLNWAGSSVEME